MALHGCISEGVYSGTLADSVPQNLNFVVDLYDSHNYHNPANNPHRFYAPDSGLFQFSMHYKVANGHGKIWNVYLTGSHDTSPYADGAAIYGVTNSDGIAEGITYCDGIEWTGWMNAGEYISATISQHAASPGSISASVTARASIIKIGANKTDHVCSLRGVDGGYHPEGLFVIKDTITDVPWVWTSIDHDDMHAGTGTSEITIPDTGYYDILTRTKDFPNPDLLGGYLIYRMYRNATVLYDGWTLPWRQPHWHRWVGLLTAADVIKLTLEYKCTGGTPGYSSRYLWDAGYLLAYPYICVRRIDQ